MFSKKPSDSFFEEMDPVEKLWLYESWVHDIELKLESEKYQAILIGSFSNPEMARDMVSRDKPDYEISDDEFEESWKVVEEDRKKYFEQKESESKPVKRRKRKKKQIVR